VNRYLKSLFLKLYPIIRFLDGFGYGMIQLLYIYKFVPFSNPWQYLTGLEMKRLDANDYVRSKYLTGHFSER
jgi:hypothetical protein